MPNLSSSHVASLPRPIASPSMALREDGTAFIVGSGIQSYRPGAPVTDIHGPSDDHPVECGVTIDGDVLTTYGGHPEGDEYAALDEISTFSAATGEATDVDARRLPFPRRGICAVRHGKKAVLFGGISTDGHPSRDIVVVSPGQPIRALKALLGVSCAYLQAGASKPGGTPVVFLLGSGAQDWQPPKKGYDLMVSKPGDVVFSELFPALQGSPRIGVTVIQKDAETFYSFGGADGNGGVSSKLYRHFNGGTDEVGDVIGPDGQPYRVCYAAGIFAENAIHLIGGLAGSPYSSTSTATDKIVKVSLA